MTNLILADRKTGYLSLSSTNDWLNEDHLGGLMVEVVDQLDQSKLTRQYAGRRSRDYNLGDADGDSGKWLCQLCLLPPVGAGHLRFGCLWLYCNGNAPCLDTLATCFWRIMDEFSGLSVLALEQAREMKLLRLGSVCLEKTRYTPTPHATADCVQIFV